MQSIKKAIIKRFIKLGQYAIESIGGETKAHYISPKGLYSKSISENGLVLQILEDEGNKFVIPLQKPINLNDGDIIITDDKSFIKFNFNSGKIEISSSSLVINVLGAVSINSATLVHNGINIGHTHIHPQGADSDGDTQQNTGAPQ
jgi:hypothetical protein